jgi:hypothetical protein
MKTTSPDYRPLPRPISVSLSHVTASWANASPSWRKLRDRVFDEAEQIAATEAHDDDIASDTFTLPETGLPDVPQPAPRSPGRKPLPAHLPRQRIEYDLPDDQKICPCCAHALHRMGEEISEQLHIEVKASVLQHVRFK